jgi:glutathione S-transferase
MARLGLVIGNKTYSSWSMRAWLALKHTNQPFQETVVPLDLADTHAAILRHSPSGRVPVLHHGDVTVWDSLAIGEYLAEAFPDAGLWPAARAARAVARAVSAEMHAGFAALRDSMPMDVHRRYAGRGMTPEVARDIARITGIWRDCRARFDGDRPFLFGRFTIADAMYAPVATRFTTYAVELDPVSAAYVEAIQALPAMREWLEAARREPWVIGHPTLWQRRLGGNDVGHGRSTSTAPRALA